MTVVLLAVKADKMQAIVKPTRWQRIEFMSRLSTKKIIFISKEKPAIFAVYVH